MRKPPRLVVRHEHPSRRRRLFALAVLAAVLALAFAYFAGAYWSASVSLRTAGASGQLRQALLAQSAANEKLRSRTAFLEQSLALSNQSEAATRKNLFDEQAKQVALRQKLALYEGILTQGEDRVPVKIAGLQIIPTGNAREYRFQIVLVRANGKADKSLSGSCGVTISGEKNGKALRLSLAKVMPDGADPIKFKLRYFSNLGGTLRLPAGFKPAKVDIVIKTEGAVDMTGSYSWPAFQG